MEVWVMSGTVRGGPRVIIAVAYTRAGLTDVKHVAQEIWVEKHTIVDKFPYEDMAWSVQTPK